MKTVINHSLKLACLAALLACAPVAARAQQPKPTAQALAQPISKLQIENLDALAARAEHVVDVTIDESMLKFIPMIIRKQSKTSADAQKIAKIAAGFRGVYVRSFTFSDEGQWAESDIAGIRAQLKQPGWSRIVSVKTRKDGQNVEVYVMTDPANLGGLAILATQPNELTVVNIVGKIDIEDILALEGNFGIPDLDIQIGGSDREEKKPEPKRNAPPATKKP
ncbi:MAG: DUF4252 domain-containing protein [Acidobacteria bacterium]|nr:DUF4252 domain-containing protein [Acidobacteriota bacterium]